MLFLCSGFKEGSPVYTCVDGYPIHRAADYPYAIVDAQTRPSPYTIELDKTSYKKGDKITGKTASLQYKQWL